MGNGEQVFDHLPAARHAAITVVRESLLYPFITGAEKTIWYQRAHCHAMSARTEYAEATVSAIGRSQ
jgi:hypothetical protein